VIDNRSGPAGNLGAEAAFKAGLTAPRLITAPSPMTVNQTSIKAPSSRRIRAGYRSRTIPTGMM
jgi:hypothetical protein